jgi:radical SAM protein with 4Fe4S-binding SPASM domain
MAGWHEFCHYLTELGFEVALITNGTLLDEDALSRLDGAGVGHIGISVDGCKSTHDATRRFIDGSASPFDRTMFAIRTATRRLSVTAITQVNRTNLHELQALGQILSELGVLRWQLQLAVPTPRVLGRSEPYVLAPSELRALTDFIVNAAQDRTLPFIHTSDNIGYATKAEVILRRKTSGPGLWLGCIAGIRSVAIKYDGTVRGCSLLPREFEAGDLHTESLAEIWNDPRRFAVAEKLSRANLSGECQRCTHGGLCRAGCTTMAYFSTGTTGDNPYCLHRLEENEREPIAEAL